MISLGAFHFGFYGDQSTKREALQGEIQSIRGYDISNALVCER